MEQILEKYQKQPTELIQALQDVQIKFGYISRENLKLLSEGLEVPYAYTYAIASFYKSFSLEKRGKYVVTVCDGTTCHIKGSNNLLEEVADNLGLKPGETSEDELFTLETVGCLGVCALAPVVMVNDQYYGNLTVVSLKNLLDECRKG